MIGGQYTTAMSRASVIRDGQQLAAAGYVVTNGKVVDTNVQRNAIAAQLVQHSVHNSRQAQLQRMSGGDTGLRTGIDQSEHSIK